MNYPFIALIVSMSVLLGYILYWTVKKLSQVWRLYVKGKELSERWDGEVVDIMTGEKNEHE